MTITSTSVIIVGTGIAGAWLAYRLAQRGIETVVISSESVENTPAVSREWAASVINKRLVEDDPDSTADLFKDASTTQHPELQPMVRRYLRQEFTELSEIVDFMPFHFALIPRHAVPVPRLGAGNEVVTAVLGKFVSVGGKVIEGRVTHLSVADGVCRGLQFERNGEPHKLLCQALVLASGGFSGLFADSMTNNTGSLLGTFARCGGTLANLEFFKRFALGDITRRRLLYPQDLEEAYLYRDGERATWLYNAQICYPPEKFDLEVFQTYWSRNFGVPHTAELASGSVSLGPIRGFSMGGIAHHQGVSNLSNVFATGEARHDLAVDYTTSLPWACYLATGGMLSDVLSKIFSTESLQDFPLKPVPHALNVSLLSEVRRHLANFQDQRFSEKGAVEFIAWCREVRKQMRCNGQQDDEDFDLLILAEAYTQSALVRTESRGYFFRADFPCTNPIMSNQCTYARYDIATDRVDVDMVVHDKELSKSHY